MKNKAFQYAKSEAVFRHLNGGYKKTGKIQNTQLSGIIEISTLHLIFETMMKRPLG